MNQDEKILTCVDCGQEFILTVGEQDFYKRNNLAEPKRCSECRARRKQKEVDPNGSSQEK